MKRIFFVLPLIFAFLILPLTALAQQGGASGKSGQKAATTKQSTKTDQGGQQGAGAGGMSHDEMMQKCKEMQAKREQMKEDMKAMDARLDEKVAAMNAAGGGDEKMAAMAAVITEMANQRKEMREKFSSMHHGMMCGMMGKGGGKGMMGGGKGGMMGGCCGMMQQGADAQNHGGHTGMMHGSGA